MDPEGRKFGTGTRVSLFVLASCWLLAQHGAGASRILMLAPVSTSSHLTVFRALADGLAARGHEVTILHTLTPESPRYFSRNSTPAVGGDGDGSVVEVSPPKIFNLFAKYFDNPFKFQREARNGRGAMRLRLMFDILRNSCRDIYGDDDFMRAVTETRFDVAIVQGILNDCVLGVVGRMGIPYMYLSPGPVFPSVQWSLGTPWSVSSAPAPFVQGFGVPRTLLNRLRNLLAAAAETFMTNKLGAWAAEPVVNEAFRARGGPAGAGPPFELATVKQNVSFVLVNHLAAFDYSRPHASNSALVGGMHCRPCIEIQDKGLKAFLDNSTEGVAYFSLGSTAQGVDMPAEVRGVFMAAFAKLPLRVVWKLETAQLSEAECKAIPGNVYPTPWVPQQDVLGHVNVKVFLTHGGILSVQEATYHAVPMVGIPIGSDQDINLKRATSDGRAVLLDFDTLTVDKIVSAVRLVTTDESFQARADAGSRLMKDEPTSPLQRAVFWTEYVIRHGGAHHLRTDRAYMPWFQYLNLDMYATLFAACAACLWLSAWLAVRFSRACLVPCLAACCCGREAAAVAVWATWVGAGIASNGRAAVKPLLLRGALALSLDGLRRLVGRGAEGPEPEPKQEGKGGRAGGCQDAGPGSPTPDGCWNRAS